MNPAGQPHRFPARLTLACLTPAAVAAGLLAGLVLPMIYGRDPLVGQAVLVMSAAAWASAMLGVLPVALLGPHGVMPTVYGYFIGAALRIVLSLAAGVVAVRVLALPMEPVALTLVGVYLPLLFIEAGIVGRYLWQKDLPAAMTASHEVAPS